MVTQAPKGKRFHGPVKKTPDRVDLYFMSVPQRTFRKPWEENITLIRMFPLLWNDLRACERNANSPYIIAS